MRELRRLTTFLLQLNEVLWQQLHNGRRPVFRSLRHSVKSIYDAEQQFGAPHESMVSDVKKLMHMIEHATLDPPFKRQAPGMPVSTGRPGAARSGGKRGQ